MASGDTKTEAMLNVLGNGGSGDEFRGCCNTKTQQYILDAIDRINNIQPGGGGINVVQTTGTSTTDVMSQKAVTDFVDGLVIKHTSAPTESSVGTVGQVWEDTTNGGLYQLSQIGQGYNYTYILTYSPQTLTVTFDSASFMEFINDYLMLTDNPPENLAFYAINISGDPEDPYWAWDIFDVDTGDMFGEVENETLAAYNIIIEGDLADGDELDFSREDTPYTKYIWTKFSAETFYVDISLSSMGGSNYAYMTTSATNNEIDAAISAGKNVVTRLTIQTTTGAFKAGTYLLNMIWQTTGEYLAGGTGYSSGTGWVGYTYYQKDADYIAMLYFDNLATTSMVPTNGTNTAPTTSTPGVVGQMYSYVEISGNNKIPHVCICTGTTGYGSSRQYIWADLLGSVETALNAINNGTNS